MSHWEVDPETRTKLLTLQQQPANSKCVDCNAPSPQWASPKNGIFMCLTCAGIHRGLGVHISFVRSITMDSLKTPELKRMELGGNDRWKDFFNAHDVNKSQGRTFEELTIKERYEGEVAEEWRRRLAARAEGKEFVPLTVEEKARLNGSINSPATSNTGVGVTRSSSIIRQSRSRTANSSSSTSHLRKNESISSSSTPRSGSPQKPSLPPSQKEKNEAYFAKMGAANAGRSEHLPPSQGGKYAGFGSDPFPDSRGDENGNGEGPPGLDEWQKDPVGALTKGFGWFTTTVGKGAKQVNDEWLVPGVQKIQQSDALSQARQTAATASRSLNQSFNNFVEGGGNPNNHNSSSSLSYTSTRRREPEKKDFWDSFGAADASGGNGGGGGGGAMAGGAIGTSTMKGGSGNGGGNGGNSGKDGWGDDDDW
ncbi:MAG: Zn finger-containing GTPase- Activating Protein for ARF [Cirrosporium novae-zelandiae]|nr:MAG: Zn finger-containing GTPase- Activating Protein for ARF [Cirrosporium novae-zelandiae]